jgi:aqualysin 1
MIRHMLLSTLAIMALLFANIDVARAQEITAPMIVVFHEQASFESFRGMYQVDERARLSPEGWGYLDRNVAGAVQALEAALRFRADHVYSAALRGFAARLTAQQISTLENHPLVAYIVPDGIMTINAQTLPWGIDRINADQSSTKAGDGQGAITNVNVYIIDTGIDITHADLNVVGHIKMLPFPSFNNTDCNGHGTHVAGTVSAIDNTSEVVGAAP